MRLADHFKKKFSAVLSGGAGILGLVIGLSVLAIQLIFFLLVYGMATKGVSAVFGIGSFFSGVIVGALVFLIPFGEIFALGFLLYGIYVFVWGG